MKITWVGPFLRESPEQTAVSRAASVWQMQQVNALLNLNVEVSLLNSGYNRAWPRGSVFGRYASCLKKTTKSNWYLNLPRIREKTVRKYLVQDLTRTVSEERANDAVVVYNDILFARKWKQSLRPTGSTENLHLVLADYPANSDRKKSKYIKESIEYFDKVIFLSRSAQEGLNVDCPSIVYPGALGEIRFPSRVPFSSKPYKIVFAGSKGPNSGFEQLLSAVSEFTPKEYMLLSTGGPHRSDKIDDLQAKGLVKQLGVVSDGELKSLFSEADLLINPYKVDYWRNRYNFPSKIFKYLESGNLVCATGVPSIPREIKDHLYEIGPEVLDLKKDLRQILACDPVKMQRRVMQLSKGRESLMIDVKIRELFEFLKTKK